MLIMILQYVCMRYFPRTRFGQDTNTVCEVFFEKQKVSF